jgi:hypothetical protein
LFELLDKIIMQQSVLDGINRFVGFGKPGLFATIVNGKSAR